ncbi:MAG: hypothetical protein JWO07_482 [Candidatus Saccharibacteria bacterium]|nr:hypothetical protein [Candidatus Saccharibacteria bacterium]
MPFTNWPLWAFPIVVCALCLGGIKWWGNKYYLLLALPYFASAGLGLRFFVHNQRYGWAVLVGAIVLIAAFAIHRSALNERNGIWPRS